MNPGQRLILGLKQQSISNPIKKFLAEKQIGGIILFDHKNKFFPRKEFQLLHFLASNPGKVMKRETLLKEIWGNDVYVIDRTIDVHIRKVREKLGKHSEIIETIKGVGYRFKHDE